MIAKDSRQIQLVWPMMFVLDMYVSINLVHFQKLQFIFVLELLVGLQIVLLVLLDTRLKG